MESFITHWHQSFFDPERIPVALAAIALVSILGALSGPINGNANACVWVFVDTLIGKIGDKLDRKNRAAPDLFFRGFIVVLLVVCLMAIAAKVIEGAALQGTQWSGIFNIVILSLFLSAGSVWFVVLKLYFALSEKKGQDHKSKKDKTQQKGTYFGIARSMRANLNVADDYGIVRITTNFLARSFDKNMVAPVFWFIIAGFLGVCLYSGLAALAWRFGKEGTGKGFGSTALALEKLMGFIPSLYAGILIVLAGLFTPTAKFHKGVAGLLSIRGNGDAAPYQHGGAPVAAMAWALNLSLGGPYQDLKGDAIKAPWIGPREATSKNDYSHLRRALYIHVIAHVLWVSSLLGMYIWAHLIPFAI